MPGSPSAHLLMAVSWSAFLAYGVHVVSGMGGQAFDLLLLLALATVSLSCALAARVGRTARGSWTLLSIGIAAYGASALYYTLVPDAAGQFPSAGDIGLVVFYPCVFAALTGLVRAHVAGFSSVLWIDSAVGALVVAAVGATVVDTQLGGAPDLRVVGQLLFLLGDLGLLGFLAAAYALSGRRARPNLLFLAAGAAVLAVGDAAYVLEVATGSTAPTVMSLLAWPVGILLMAVAPFQELRRVPPASSLRAKVAVPGASAIACLPIVLFSTSASPQNVLASLALGVIVVRLILSLLDNSKLLAAARQTAITDALTGLANRTLLFDRLEQARLREARGGRLVGVMFLDLDEFKTINDEHGHDLGDRVLTAVAGRLRKALRGEDTVARGDAARSLETIGRLGGDEFVVVLDGLGEPADVTAVAERILAEVRAPLAIGSHEIFLDASVGITVTAAGDDRGAGELLRDADTAMYAAKQAGKGRYQLFETDMHDQLVARNELISDLRSAVTEGQLRLLYQPQVDLPSGRMSGVEALVRWQHPSQGLLTPDRFIPLAESTGMIVQIDDWVLREACGQVREWDDGGCPPLEMAVNVSAHRLVAGDLAATVDAVLAATTLEPARLEIELTETVAVEHDAVAVAVITRVRDLGVRVAIDDFGMGHSALSRLQSFPVDRLKIDRSFVSPLTQGGERGSIADAMLAIGQSLGLQVVAEGVETEEHLRALRALGCGFAQGYLFSKPVSAAEIERLARERVVLAPLEEVVNPLEPPEPTSVTRERQIRNLLAELGRVTGLETTYLTRVNLAQALQRITHARNTSTLDIPEGLTVDWSDTVCRRALEQGITYTDDVPATFADSQAAAALGLQTYVSVPLRNADGDIQGTLCGASTRRVRLGPEAITLMERFADLITQGVGSRDADTLQGLPS